MIEGQGYCAAGIGQNNLEKAIDYCKSKKNLGIHELQAALDDMEPGGAVGQVQVGYTLQINLLTLFSSGDANPMAFYTKALHDIDRPVVIYLMANQFASSALRTPLGNDSLARFADQSIPSENYFGAKIQAISLGTNPTLEINRKRDAALELIGKWYRSLPAASKKKIIAITMAGELHHFFDDFSNGMGKFDAIRVTDYAPVQVLEFRAWLKKKYGDINRMNAAMQADFKNFEQIIPPSKDIRTEKVKSIFEHFDSYANGVMPIDGWLERKSSGENINIYLDGRLLGKAEYGLSRQDVYEAVDSIQDSGVGFRYLLDFSKLPRGIHTLQIMLEGNRNFEIGKRQISVMGRDQSSLTDYRKSIPAANAPKGLRYWLDRPKQEISVFYNPLARDWYSYRSQQVTNAYEAWLDHCVESGLPQEKLYTHQIAAATVGSWNPILTASDESISGEHRYKKGINLYGGSINLKLLQQHYLKAGETFGSPEFHTMNWKNPALIDVRLREFKEGGAKFITPYFISLAPDKYRSRETANNRFRISPDNRDFGSNLLYDAIRRIAKD